MFGQLSLIVSYIEHLARERGALRRGKILILSIRLQYWTSFKVIILILRKDSSSCLIFMFINQALKSNINTNRYRQRVKKKRSS